MKIAISADWHLKGKGLTDTRNQLLELCEKAVDCDLLCVAGDIFDRPGIGDDIASTGAIAEVAIEAVAAFPQALLIPGNHDYAGAGSKDALHVFDGMKNVTVARSPDIHRPFNGLTIACVPWMWTGRLEVRLDSDILLAHVRTGGALMGRTMNYEIKPGDWNISRADLEAIPAKHVALGDFHRRQDLTGGRGGYVGALKQNTFGEEGNPQGFEILDTETWETEWIQLTSCPTYRTVEVDPGDPVPVRGEYEHLRVRYTSMPDTNEVRDLEASGVQVQHIVEREERVRRAEIEPGVMSDRRALIRLWASSQEPPVEGERLERMIETYEEVIV